jgi:hypothetical protein
MDDFERELQQAFDRRPAPPSLKRKLMERRQSKGRRLWVRSPFFTWQWMAASVVLVAALAGGVEWNHLEEVRREEAAREQVLTALRITSHALNQMNARLAARGKATD